jgi:hypothetical protein
VKKAKDRSKSKRQNSNSIGKWGFRFLIFTPTYDIKKEWGNGIQENCGTEPAMNAEETYKPPTLPKDRKR